MAYRPAQVYTGSGWDDIGDKRLLTHNHNGTTGGANIPQSSVTNLVSDLAAKAPTASPTFTGNVVWSGAALRIATAEIATEQQTTSSTYGDMATVGPSVTVTTGTKALIIVSASIYNGSANASALMSWAVSGASTVAASDTWCLSTYDTSTGFDEVSASRAHILYGLTAGSNTFTAKYRAGGGGNASFKRRSIIVMDLGS